MTLAEVHGLLKISRIADRYLVFDPDQATVLRRYHNICGVLVGTSPQNPTQNVFLGLPIELFPDEAALLLKAGAALLIDERSQHLKDLQSRDGHTRLQYREITQRYQRHVKRLLANDQATKTLQNLADNGTMSLRNNESNPTHSTALLGKQVKAELSQATLQAGAGMEPFQCPLAHGRPLIARPLTVTLTASPGLSQQVDEEVPCLLPSDTWSSSRLHNHLSSKGYFMTPGLRFGADYSVYPGDPLRYHAHFLANEYEWQERICLLDLVGTGRLGTAVKKGFLIGGQDPDSGDDGRAVRAFSIEWAGM